MQWLPQVQLLFAPFSTTAVCFHASGSRDANPTAVASLALLVWNCFVTLDDEVQYIWTMRNKNLFKWVYFFLRYVVLFAHIAHNCLIGIFADGSNPPRLCNIWFVYVVVFSQTLESLLEFTLASRGKSRVISPLEDSVRLDKIYSVCSIQPIQKDCIPAVDSDFNGAWGRSENNIAAEIHRLLWNVPSTTTK
ncbi:hypothetical protein HD554DRAFT_1724837 [Boletus coccyginus]|nr:hypothetical protein HD554DRAFT_1724837 [Boletus coccyginus]